MKNEFFTSIHVNAVFHFEGNGEFATRCVILIFGEFDNYRLKSEENSRLSLGWNLNRELTKINYRIHTDAIKEHLIPEDISARAQSFIYANEADVLNGAE